MLLFGLVPVFRFPVVPFAIKRALVRLTGLLVDPESLRRERISHWTRIKREEGVRGGGTFAKGRKLDLFGKWGTIAPHQSTLPSGKPGVFSAMEASTN